MAAEMSDTNNITSNEALEKQKHLALAVVEHVGRRVVDAVVAIDKLQHQALVWNLAGACNDVITAPLFCPT